MSQSTDSFYSTEVGKRYLDLFLKQMAFEQEQFYIVNEIPTTIPPRPSYAIRWFDRETRQPVAQPWSGTQYLTQDIIDRVVLARVPPSETFLRSDQSIIFTFPAVTIHPVNPNFPNFVISWGTDSDNTIAGDVTPDLLLGLAGNDTINGNDGNDGIVGGDGQDILTGGAGSDRFALSGADVESITDFNPSQDIVFLDFGLSKFPGLTPNAFLPSNQFHTGVTATTANHRLIYDSNSGALFFDADGNGAIAQQQIAQLSPGLALSHNNLFASNNADYLFTLPGPGSNPTPGPGPNPTPIPTPRGQVYRGTNGNDTLTGTAADDQLLGLLGNDKLTGGEGNDLLKGGKGNDKHFGGSGNDQFWGGTGNDLFNGGAGADIFALERGRGRVVIQDYQNNQDKLRLTSGIGFNQLNMTQLGRNVLIRSGQDQLALLINVGANQITRADFVNS